MRPICELHDVREPLTDRRIVGGLVPGGMAVEQRGTAEVPDQHIGVVRVEVGGVVELTDGKPLARRGGASVLFGLKRPLSVPGRVENLQRGAQCAREPMSARLQGLLVDIKGLF